MVKNRFYINIVAKQQKWLGNLQMYVQTRFGNSSYKQ